MQTFKAALLGAGSGAAPFLQYRVDPLDVMLNVIRLHLDDEPDWNLFHLSVRPAQCHGTVPRVRDTLEEL